jgi:hypothetical protein
MIDLTPDKTPKGEDEVNVDVPLAPLPRAEGEVRRRYFRQTATLRDPQT